MKKLQIILLFLFLFSVAFAQGTQKISGKSSMKVIRAGKQQITQTTKAIPDLIIKGEVFIDANKNNTIDGDEICYLNFNIENLGQGAAKKVIVRVTLKNKDIQGLYFIPETIVGTIEPNKSKEVSIRIEGQMKLSDGIAEFKIEALEDLGFDAYPLEMKIETHPFQPPNVVVADAVFSTEGGGKVKLNYPINLKLLIQNIGNGDAQNVNVTCSFVNLNCLLLGETDKYPVGELKKGETREIDFLFTATRRYVGQEIPIAIDISESYNKYARDTTVKVSLDQTLVSQNNVVIAAIPTTQTTIQKASLTSDVDKNIPANQTKYSYKYALIIGNEDYSKYQQGLSTEMNVTYARNDASVFREYAVMTLGCKEENVYLLLDATAGEMNQKLDLISKLAIKTGTDAEILFYYAGHGLPDEATKTPYLIPVDVNGTNLTSAIRLSDVYKKLSETNAKKITIILDACFSGGGREAGLLAARSVKIKPSDELLTGNMVTFSASSMEQSALQYNREKHGIFTYFLLKKIQMSNGNVTYGDLADYLSKTVSLESLKVNQKEQDPTVNVSAEVKDVWEQWKLNN